VLDGLANLKKVNLAINKISSIGLHVFTQKANLTSLRDINLAFNSLTTLEPWPLIRGQLVSGSTVNLHKNRISVFTNRLGWSYRCGMKPRVEMSLNLTANMMQHAADLTNGWNISGKHCRVHSLYNYYEALQTDLP
jgi:hypothetical protein